MRSGDLSPDDLVYDGETGSWSPARTHPVVLDVQYELEAAEEAAEAAGTESQADSEAGGAPGADSDEAPESASEADSEAEADASGMEGITFVPEAKGDDAGAAGQGEGGESAKGTDLEFDLALTKELSPEDEQRAFLEKLEAERHHDVDQGMSIRDSISGFTTDTLAPRPEEPRRAADPPPPRPPAAPRIAAPAPKKRGGVGRAVALFVVALLVAGGGYVGYRALSAEPVSEVPDPDGPLATAPGDSTDPQPEAIEPEPEPTPEAVIPDTPGAVRERAQERYLAATQTALRTLQSIPEAWPEGPYLTVPSDHPEVVDVWQDYRATIQQVRQVDVERYRTAYEAALDDAAVVGEDRAERLQRAMDEFGVSQELRDAHFDRVEALATAAIQSHNALVEAEGLILFDATGSTGRPSGIGAGTSARNAEAQLLLDQVIELLEGALDADGDGPGSGENVREWGGDVFLAAISRRGAVPPSATIRGRRRNAST